MDPSASAVVLAVPFAEEAVRAVRAPMQVVRAVRVVSGAAVLGSSTFTTSTSAFGANRWHLVRYTGLGVRQGTSGGGTTSPHPVAIPVVA